jgi:hypothetical protein
VGSCELVFALCIFDVQPNLKLGNGFRAKVMGGCGLNVVTLGFTSADGWPRVNWCLKDISSMASLYFSSYLMQLWFIYRVLSFLSAVIPLSTFSSSDHYDLLWQTEVSILRNKSHLLYGIWQW